MEELAQLKERLAGERPRRWEELPDIPLYMDQVVSYLARQQLEPGEELTSAMINNYVKDGLVPRARGKKYEREHLGELTVISALKQVLSVREMQVLLELSRVEPRLHYDSFWQELDEALGETAHQLDADTAGEDLAGLALRLALRGYANGLACRQVLAILARQEGRSDLLSRRKK